MTASGVDQCAAPYPKVETMPTKATAKKTAAPKMVPWSQPLRVDIRIAGRLLFTNNCWGVELKQNDDGTVTFSATTNIEHVAAPPTPAAPERFGDDIRDGQEIIQQVHSGRRDNTGG